MLTAGDMAGGLARGAGGERCWGRGRSPIGQRHAAGLDLFRHRLDGARVALDGSPRFSHEVELKQRRSRDAPFLVGEDRGARGVCWPSFRPTGVSVDGAQNLRRGRDRFRSAGERFSTVAEKAEMGSPGWAWVDEQLVCGGRWLSRTEARRFAEDSAGGCHTSLRQVNERGTARRTERCPQARWSGRRLTPAVRLPWSRREPGACRWLSGAL